MKENDRRLLRSWDIVQKTKLGRIFFYSSANFGLIGAY